MIAATGLWLSYDAEQIGSVTGLGAMTAEATTRHYESTIPDGSRILLTKDDKSIDYLSPEAAASDANEEGEHIVLEKQLDTGLNNVSFTTQDDNTYSCNFYYKGKAGYVDFNEILYVADADPVWLQMVATTTTFYDDKTIIENRCGTYTSGPDKGIINNCGWRRTTLRKDGGRLEYANDFDKISKILYDKDGNEVGHFYIYSDMYDYFSINWGNKKLSGEWSLYSPTVDITDEDGKSYFIGRNTNGVVYAHYNGEDSEYFVKNLRIVDTVFFPTFTVAGSGDQLEFDYKLEKVKVTCVSSFQKIDQSLEKVVIGKNITTISKKAFCGCKKLKTIVIKSTKIKKIGKGAFKNINKNATIKLSGTKAQKARIKKLIKQSGIAKTVKIK
jgi:hypothetical protein